MSDDLKIKSIHADSCATEHLYSTRDDEVTYVGTDLIPDDIDMYPRNLGNMDAPFRQVWADAFYGSVDPKDERDAIGAGQPFHSIRAKTLFGNLCGTIQGIPYPGALTGYGWLLVKADTAPEGNTVRILRTSWPKICYSLDLGNAHTPSILVHPLLPFVPFQAGSPVMAEIVQTNALTLETSTRVQCPVPVMNDALKTPQIRLTIDIPKEVSGQYMLLIRLY